MDRLVAARDRESRVAVGLMSGTSCDGIDACVVRIKGCGSETEVETLATLTRPLHPAIRAKVFQVFLPGAGLDPLPSLNMLLGQEFACAALDVVAAAGLSPRDIDFVGSHGQTVRHFPAHTPGATLQIAEPAVIAAMTGITTIADFRPADMAVGGQGAPLLPKVDYLLFRHPASGRMLLNIGGIANVAVLPPACSEGDLLAFDLGPGNMLLDAAAVHFSAGKASYDVDGAMAARGTPNAQALAELLAHPFFSLPPPKSTGREEFGAVFCKAFLKRHEEISPEDIMATLSAFTIQTIILGITTFVLPLHEMTDLFVSGGGVHNKAILHGLQAGLPGIKVSSMADLGCDPDAREAVAFAVLANETVCGNAGNMPAATGALTALPLGKISFPPGSQPPSMCFPEDLGVDMDMNQLAAGASVKPALVRLLQGKAPGGLPSPTFLAIKAWTCYTPSPLHSLCMVAAKHELAHLFVKAESARTYPKERSLAPSSLQLRLSLAERLVVALGTGPGAPLSVGALKTDPEVQSRVKSSILLAGCTSTLDFCVAHGVAWLCKELGTHGRIVVHESLAVQLASALGSQVLPYVDIVSVADVPAAIVTESQAKGPRSDGLQHTFLLHSGDAAEACPDSSSSGWIAALADEVAGQLVVPPSHLFVQVSSGVNAQQRVSEFSAQLSARICELFPSETSHSIRTVTCTREPVDTTEEFESLVAPDISAGHISTFQTALSGASMHAYPIQLSSLEASGALHALVACSLNMGLGPKSSVLVVAL